MTRIGILALQGDFEEHLASLRQLEVEGVQVRLPADLQGLNGLIIPGGESTTIGKLAVTYDLIGPLKKFGRSNAIWGTCAGAIFLSKDARRDQPLLGLMDIRVERNAFGRQAQSFTIDLDVPALKDPQRPFPAVFIRAPVIERAGAGVTVLATLPGEGGDPVIVAARQGRFLATSFHPELTGDSRFHRYFIHMAGS